jgi:hypothetical protein
MAVKIMGFRYFQWWKIGGIKSGAATGMKLPD